MGLDTKPLRLRLVRVQLNTGETEILITSLIHFGLYPVHIFHELYHESWPVEEDYKKAKCWIEIDTFLRKICAIRIPRFSCKSLFKERNLGFSVPNT